MHCHRALDKVIVHYTYPISLITDLFYQLSNAKYFMKFDLRLDYYQALTNLLSRIKRTLMWNYNTSISKMLIIIITLIFDDNNI